MKTREQIEAMEIGGVLCDWHYGKPELPEGCEIKSLITFEATGGSAFISKQTDRPYHNKLAVLVAFNNSGDRVFNVSYDDRYFTVFTVSISR